MLYLLTIFSPPPPAAIFLTVGRYTETRGAASPALAIPAFGTPLPAAGGGRAALLAGLSGRWLRPGGRPPSPCPPRPSPARAGRLPLVLIPALAR